MAKKKLLGWIDVLIGLLVAIAVGGLFASGTTLGFPILSYLPEIVHTVVGWAIIIGAGIRFVMDLVK